MREAGQMRIPEIPGLSIDRENIGAAVIHAQATTTERPAECPSCGSDQLTPHAILQKTVLDSPIQDRRVEITVNQRRYRCSQCGKTTLARISSIHPNTRVTERFFKLLGQASLDLTLETVASQYGLSNMTLSNIRTKYAQRVNSTRELEIPSALGVETFYHKGLERLLFVDLDGRTLYDLLESASADTLRHGLARLQNSSRTQTVLIPLNESHRDMAETMLPDARIAVSPMSVRIRAHQAVKAVKEALSTKLAPVERWLLTTADHFLDTPRPRLNPSQRASLAELETLSNEGHEVQRLIAAYHAAEDLSEVFGAKSKVEATVKAGTWAQTAPVDGEPAMEELRRLVRACWEQIHGWYNVGLTESEVSAIGSLRERVESRAHQYSFEVLRAKYRFAHARTPRRTPPTQNQTHMVYFACTRTFENQSSNTLKNKGPRIDDFIKDIDVILGPSETDEGRG